LGDVDHQAIGGSARELEILRRSIALGNSALLGADSLLSRSVG
jgi:hypothetical protein